MFIQLIPLYFQVAHPGSSNINDLGALRTLHPMFLLAGVVLLWGVGLQNFSRPFKRHIYGAFIGLYLLSGLLILLQLLLLGEVRYFAIKVALLLETLLLVLGVALLFSGILSRGKGSWNYLWCAPLVPIVVLALLLSTVSDPFKETRGLFRDELNQAKPMFYDQNVRHFTHLGVVGQINHYNATVLHYDAKKPGVVGHSLLAAWAQNVKYSRGPDDDARACHRLVYRITTQESADPKLQQALVAQVQQCIDIANKNGYRYYIITDNGSIPYLQNLFEGDVAFMSA